MRLVRLFIVCSLILLSAVYSSKAVEIEKPKEKLSKEDIEKIRNFFKDHPFPDSAYNVEIKKAAMNNQKEIRVDFILVPNPDFFSLFEKIKPVDAEVLALDRLFISPLMGAREDYYYGYVFPFDIEFELKSQTGEILQRYTRPFEFAVRTKYVRPIMNECPKDSSLTSCLALFGKTNVLVNPGEVHIPLSVDSQSIIKDVSASVVTKRNKEEAQKKQEDQESSRREGEKMRREREAEEEARRDTL